MKRGLWILPLALLGIWLTPGPAAQLPKPQLLGLSPGSSGRQEVLAAIERAQGGNVQVLHPLLTDEALQSRYQGITNPKEARITAEGLAAGSLFCDGAEFLLFEDVLYRVACRAMTDDGERSRSLRQELESAYGRPAKASEHRDAGEVRWELGEKTLSLRRDASGELILTLSDATVAARAAASRRELVDNPVLLMEEMRRSSEPGAASRR